MATKKAKKSKKDGKKVAKLKRSTAKKVKVTKVAKKAPAKKAVKKAAPAKKAKAVKLPAAIKRRIDAYVVDRVAEVMGRSKSKAVREKLAEASNKSFTKLAEDLNKRLD